MENSMYNERPMFITSNGALIQYNLQRVEVLGIRHFEDEHPPMYHIRFNNGFETDAYGEELL